jgi:hypothetical protein
MYLSIVRGKVQPWKDFYGSRLREMPELQQSYYAADRATDTTLGVSLWSEKPDEAQLRQIMQEFRAQISDLLAEPPSLEWYEVLQHI